MSRLSPAERLARYGPTTGDRDPPRRHGPVGRASTEDRQATGDEPIWGYAKTLRPRIDPGSGVGRRSSTRSWSARSSSTPSIGVVKADIGIKDGRIVGVGRAGNPRDQRRASSSPSARTRSRSRATA